MLGRKKNNQARKESAEPSSNEMHSSSSMSMPPPSKKGDRHHQQHGLDSPPTVSSSFGSEKSSGGSWFPRKGWFTGGSSSSSSGRERVASSGAVESSSSSKKSSSGGRTISGPSSTTFPSSQSVQAGLGTSSYHSQSTSPLSPPYPRPGFTQHPSTSSTSISSLSSLAPPSRGWLRRPTTLSNPTPPPAHLLASSSQSSFSTQPPTSSPSVPPIQTLPQRIPSSGSTSHSATLPHVSPTLGLPVGPHPPTTTSRSVSPNSGLLARIQSRGDDTYRGEPSAGGGSSSSGLAGIGRKSWSRSMDDLSRLLTGGGEKASTTAANKARIEEYRRKKEPSEGDGEERLASPISPVSSTSPTSPKSIPARPFPRGIEEDLSSYDDRSGADRDPISPYSDQISLPPMSPDPNPTSAFSPPTVPFPLLPPSASYQSARTARPSSKFPSSDLPVSESTPIIFPAHHSPSTNSLSSWANGGGGSSSSSHTQAMTTSKGGAGASKRAFMNAGGGLAGKVISNPGGLLGHGRSMSSGLLGKGKEKEKEKPSKSAKERLTPLEPGSSTPSALAGFRIPFASSGSSTAPPTTNSFPSSTLYPPHHSSSSMSSPHPPSSSTSHASNSNRSSQIVLQSGLVLRHTPTAPSAGPFRSSGVGSDDLSKGWKPFKIVLQGSKLYFYKASGERKIEIEARFPTGLVESLKVPSLPRRQGTDESIRTLGSGAAGTQGRRARSFWGTGRHPDLDLFPSSDDPSPLLLSREKIRSATPEALIHELIFASQMPPKEGRIEDLRLVDAVLFSSLDFTSPLRFVVELKRSVERATAASLEDGEKEALMGDVRVRVKGVVERFCGGFGGSWWNRSPEDATKVKEGLVEVLKLVFADNEGLPSLLDLVQRVGTTEGAVTPTDWVSESQNHPRPTDHPRPELQDLLRTGLTLDTFLSLDPSEFARSIHIFHSDQFSSLFIGPSSARYLSPSLFVDATDSFPYDAAAPHPLASFSFSPDRPHFLTRLVLHHIFVSVASSSTSATPANSKPSTRRNSTSADHQKPQSVTQLRGKIISQWITIGEYLRLSGDASGFMAVAMGICSRPVARLTQTWRRISDIDHTLVKESWVPLLSAVSYQDQEAQHIRPLRLTPEDSYKQEREAIPPVPFLGSVVEDIRRARRADHPSLLSTELVPGAVAMLPIWEAWDPVSAALEAAASFSSSSKPVVPEGVAWELEALFQTLASNPTPKSCETHHHFKTSLVAEPRLLGHVEEHRSKVGPASSSLNPHLTMIPLLFPQPLPTITLIDRDSLLQTVREGQMAGKTGSYANLAAVSKGSSTPLNGLDQAVHPSIVGLNAGGGRRPLRPRSLSGAQARTDSLDLAQPSSTGASSNPSVGSLSELNNGRKLFFGSMREVGGVGETVLRLCGGELVLKVVQEQFPRSGGKSSSSRPTSIIDSASHSRRTSQIGAGGTLSARDTLALSTISSSFKRCSTPGGQRDSGTMQSSSSKRVSLAGSVNSDGLGALRVDVKAGSLENLLDVLIFGVDGLKMTVKDDTGLETGSSRRLLLVDLHGYRTEFFATFRTFTTPILVFEHLKQRYHSCLAAVKTLSNPLLAPVDAFPTWPLADLSMASSSIDWSLVASLRLSVLSTLDHWMSQGAQQAILDDPHLYSSFASFLREISSSDSLQGDLRSMRKVSGSIANLSKHFSHSLLRPPVNKTTLADSSSLFPTPPPPAGSSKSVPLTSQIDKTSPLDLVNDLDSLASSVLLKITEEDLYCTAEVFELQCFEPTGWLPLLRPASQTEEDAVISDFHSILSVPLAAPGSSSGVPIAKRLPMMVRYAIRAQSTMRNWIVAQISDPSISPRRRQARLEVLISALDICRSRSADPDTVWTPSPPSSSNGFHVEPRIATFVGSAIRSAILSPESRAFAHSWHSVALVRGKSSVDGLASLLSEMEGSTPLDCTVDLGWFLERLVEVVCVVPDFVDSSMQVSSLVNFDKRRYVYNLVGNVSGMISSRPDPDRDETERLLSMERETTTAFDLRSLRDFAVREQHALCETSPHHRHLPKGFRPFSSLVSAQLEKQRRDKIARERLGKVDRRSTNPGTIKDNGDVGAGRLSVGTTQTKKKGTRSFLRGFRPLSMGHSHHHELSHTNSFDSTKSIDDLDFVPVGKASIVVSIVDSQVSELPNPPRSFVFQLASDEGARHIIQAPSAVALDAWITSLKQASRSYSEKRRTLLDGAQLEALKEVNEPQQITNRQTTQHPRSVYGVDIREVLRREAASPESIPRVVDRLLNEIESRGLSEQGIYRIPGTSSLITSLQKSLDVNSSFPLADTDIHVLCGAFKLWLRSLPEPVLPFASYEALIRAAQIQDYNERLYGIRDLVWELSRERFVLLKRIVEHLDRVTDFEEQNCMSPQSLAIVFSPSLLKPRPGPGEYGKMMNNLGHAAALVKNLILSFHWIFDDVEAVEEDDASANDAVVVVGEQEGSIREEEVESTNVVEEEEGKEMEVEVGLVQ